MNSWFVQIIRPAPILALLLLPASQVQAQVTTGGITGQVIDSSGAPVPGATVEIVHPETGLRREVTANQSGNYTMLGLAPGGPYRVTIRAIGYRPAVHEDVQVPLSQNVRVAATLVVLSRWDRDCAAMQIERARVTNWSAITTMPLLALAGLGRLARLSFSRVGYCTTGQARALPTASA
jgi:hypothetical protein